MPRIEFVPSGIVVEITDGETILDAAVKVELSFANACSGNGACGGCRVQVLRGHDALPEPSAQELKLFTKYKYLRGERAACQVKPIGDVTVTTSYW